MHWIKENISKIPSLQAYNHHVSTIEETVYDKPDLAIELCKSLLEGICKTILTNKGVDYLSVDKFPKLIKLTIETICAGTAEKDDLLDLGTRVTSVAHKIGEIRNKASFASHGQDIDHPKLSNTLSNFMFYVTDAMGGFILSYYLQYSLNSSVRIKYEDCVEFNDFFDSEHHIQLGDIVISASEALYNQDYQAYAMEYQEFLLSKIEDMEE
ncbi:MAG: abortive infection family protein [Bacteroidales bacterium]|nr:abortive infection family protein [Bacteroidales bacterium]